MTETQTTGLIALGFFFAGFIGPLAVAAIVTWLRTRKPRCPKARTRSSYERNMP